MIDFGVLLIFGVLLTSVYLSLFGVWGLLVIAGTWVLVFSVGLV